MIHPDFRMIVLANRPGFPFLGNDFFGTLGKSNNDNNNKNNSNRNNNTNVLDFDNQCHNTNVLKILKIKKNRKK